MKELSIGVYGSDSYQGGVYNMLASFGVGFYNALKKTDITVKYMKDYFESGEMPNLTVAFNVSGVESWHNTLDKGVPHMMWSVDSPFWHMPTIQKFYNYKHFIFTGVSPVDKEPAEFFFPGLEYLYIPHASDPEQWYPDETEKEYDLVFMSSLRDFKEDIDELKTSLPPSMFDMFMDMYYYAMRNPESSFWEIYSLYSDLYGYNLHELSLFYVFFMKICYAVTYQRRIDMVKKLNNYNLKIWGSPLWKEHIEGKVEYMGTADFFDANDIVRKSKIVLHIQPMQILYGLHERVLNAMNSEAYVISDNNAQMEVTFPDMISYFNSYSFENLEESIEYCLKNEEVRQAKAETARQAILAQHTWDARASSFLTLLKGN
jgi:hypothetical protein